MKQYNLYDNTGQYLGFSMSSDLNSSRADFRRRFPDLKTAVIIDTENRGYDL